MNEPKTDLFYHTEKNQKEFAQHVYYMSVIKYLIADY